MGRAFVLIGLVLAFGLALALWLWKGNAPRVGSVVAPATPAARESAPETAATESQPADRREVAAVPNGSTKATLLVVLCRAKETGAPLAEQQVRAHAGEAPAGPILEGTGTHGKLGEILVTDAEGRVEYEIPPETAVHLSAHPLKFGANASESREIGVLAPGERREVVLALATRDDARFCGRVLSHETKQPIPGAEVHGGPRGLATDAGGRFDLHYAAWSMTQLSILARGYGECTVQAQAGHETPDTALVLELERSCTLVGRLKDGGSGKYVLQALTEGYRLQEQDPSRMTGVGFDTGDRAWRGEFDATGRSEIQDLPPNAPLRVSLLDGRRPLVELPERVTILPGATREVELRLSSTCMLTGVVRDDANEPVADLTLWLLRLEPGAQLYVRHYEGEQRVGTAKTDAEGRFTIAKVGAGTWRLSPEANLRSDDEEVTADEIAPVAVLVEIPAGEAEHGVELVVHRGLTITGRVLDPDGNPAAQTQVSGYASPIYVGANVRTDGSFVLGPLPPGSFLLDASAYFSSFAPSERVRVDAGAREVVLKLRRGGKLAGRVVDASGAGLVAQIAVAIPGDKTSPLHLPTSKPDGSFEVQGLLPGSYALAASLLDGRAGVLRGVELVGGSDLRDLVIQVRPGARVRVRYEGGQSHCSARIEQDGIVVATDGIERGTWKSFSVPAGNLRLVCRPWRDGKEIVRELTLEVGGEQELVVEDQD